MCIRTAGAKNKNFLVFPGDKKNKKQNIVAIIYQTNCHQQRGTNLTSYQTHSIN